MTLLVTVKKAGQPDETFEVTRATRLLAERAAMDQVRDKRDCVIEMEGEV